MNVFCGEGGVKVMTYERADPEAHGLGRDRGRKGEQDMERGGGGQALQMEEWDCFIEPIVQSTGKPLPSYGQCLWIAVKAHEISHHTSFWI